MSESSFMTGHTVMPAQLWDIRRPGPARGRPASVSLTEPSAAGKPFLARQSTHQCASKESHFHHSESLAEQTAFDGV